MKRLFIYLLVALFVCPVFGQNTLTIHQKDGQQFSFGFADKPVITYTDNDLVLKTTETEIQYPLASLSKFTFTDIEDAVATIHVDNQEARLMLDDYVVSIIGAKAGALVTVAAADGATINTYKTNPEGSVTFSMADLPKGIYIIKTEGLTCKILKK